MKKLNSKLKFIILMISGLIGLITMFILSLYFGAEKSITFNDILNSIFHFNDDNFNEIIVRTI